MKKTLFKLGSLASLLVVLALLAPVFAQSGMFASAAPGMVSDYSRKDLPEWKPTSHGQLSQNFSAAFDGIPHDPGTETAGYFMRDITLSGPVAEYTVTVVNLRGVQIECLGDNTTSTVVWGYGLCDVSYDGNVYTVTHSYSGAKFSRVKIMGWVDNPNLEYGITGDVRPALSSGVDEVLTYNVQPNNGHWGVEEKGNYVSGTNRVPFNRNGWAQFVWVRGLYSRVDIVCDDGAHPVVRQIGYELDLDGPGTGNPATPITEAAIYFTAGQCHSGDIIFLGPRAGSTDIVGPYLP